MLSRPLRTARTREPRVWKLRTRNVLSRPSASLAASAKRELRGRVFLSRSLGTREEWDRMARYGSEEQPSAICHPLDHRPSRCSWNSSHYACGSARASVRRSSIGMPRCCSSCITCSGASRCCWLCRCCGDGQDSAARCWALPWALALSDAIHHLMVLPITVGNTGWHWP